MEIPAAITAVVREATALHIADVGKATQAAIEAVRALPEFKQLRDVLIDHAVQTLVYQARGTLTSAVAAQAAYTGPPKVNVGNSAAVNRVAASVYNHAIGGTRLGDLTGTELASIAETEEEIARGHQFNAALCRWCRDQGVKDNQRVRDVISEQKLRAAYNRLSARPRRVRAAA